MIQSAADPSKVTKVGTQAAQKLTLRASGGAAALGAGISIASDVRALSKGEKTAGEAAENAAWAAGRRPMRRGYRRSGRGRRAGHGRRDHVPGRVRP